LTDQDVREILWNAMDMEVQKTIIPHLTSTNTSSTTTTTSKKKKNSNSNKAKKKQPSGGRAATNTTADDGDDDNDDDDDDDDDSIDELLGGPKEAFLVDWLYSLRNSMGDDFVGDLAEQVGVSEEYDALLEL